MDAMEWWARADAVLEEPTMLNDAGEPCLTPEFDAFEAELTHAAAASPSDDTLQSLAETVAMIKMAIQEPDKLALLTQGAQGTPPNPDIMDAIDDGDVDAVRAALETWDVNETTGEFKTTALYQAMSNMCGASLDVINLLLDEGADPRKGLGDTNVLHGLGFARWDGIAPEALAAVVTRCVALGADIEQRSDKLFWTPLHGAVSEWNPVATEALLLAGADINARSGEVDGVCFSGADCISFANGHEPTLAVLRRFHVKQ